jgi:thiol:disulfide interchange protein DsbD
MFMVLTWYQLPGRGGGGNSALTWESNEAVAVARAASEHRPLLVDFGAAWCGACKELEERTFPDHRVREQGARFVALHVDATDDDDPAVASVRQKYHATEGLPVVLLFDSHGTEAVRFTEFVPPDRFAVAMMKVQ